MIALAPRDIPRLAEAGFDWRVLGFAAGITILTGLATGIAPVFTAARADLVVALKDSSRSATGHRGQRARGALVVAEIASTLVLAFAAGLLLGDLIAAQRRNPGYDPGHVLALNLVLPSASYPKPESIQAFYNRLRQDLHALPGVKAVGLVNCAPAAGDCGDWFYSVLDRPAPQLSEVPITLFNTADEDYFATLRIPVREGHAFTNHEPPNAVIVNETFARKWWPHRSAIGSRIKWGGPYRPGPVYQIVGVVGDVGQMGPGTEPDPELYLPFTQSPVEWITVMLRASGDPQLLTAAVRRRVAAIDPNLPIQNMQPFAAAVAASLDQRRFSALLLTLFAVLAIVLAAVGIYGLLNYWVRVREGEIAIRIALGASRPAIVRWAGWQALRLALGGIAIGALGCWAASRWLGSLVFGVASGHATTLAAASLAVAVIALAAAAIPVWRAVGVDAGVKLHSA